MALQVDVKPDVPVFPEETVTRHFFAVRLILYFSVMQPIRAILASAEISATFEKKRKSKSAIIAKNEGFLWLSKF
jgi:hypothetical protein